MKQKYDGLSLSTLEAMWENKRLVIAEMPKENILPGDLEALFSLRREIDRRKGHKPPVADVNFPEQYIPDLYDSKI